MLLRAVAKLATERDVHASRRDAPEETRKLAAQLSLGDRVTFTSGLPDDEYARLLASAEIAVVPSLYEGFSLPAVEHMASGTPLVATRAGALPEVTGDGAFLVHPETPRNSPPRCASCMTAAERALRTGRPPGSASGSPGPPSPPPPSAYRQAIDGETAC